MSKKTLKCAHSAGEREREGEGGREGGTKGGRERESDIAGKKSERKTVSEMDGERKTNK